MGEARKQNEAKNVEFWWSILLLIELIYHISTAPSLQRVFVKYIFHSQIVVRNASTSVVCVQRPILKPLFLVETVYLETLRKRVDKSLKGVFLDEKKDYGERTCIPHFKLVNYTICLLNTPATSLRITYTPFHFLPLGTRGVYSAFATCR